MQKAVLPRTRVRRNIGWRACAVSCAAVQLSDPPLVCIFTASHCARTFLQVLIRRSLVWRSCSVSVFGRQRGQIPSVKIQPRTKRCVRRTTPTKAPRCADVLLALTHSTGARPDHCSRHSARIASGCAAQPFSALATPPHKRRVAHKHVDRRSLTVRSGVTAHLGAPDGGQCRRIRAAARAAGAGGVSTAARGARARLIGAGHRRLAH